VNNDNGPGVLVGLVGAEAAAAYERLLSVTELPVGRGPGEFDLDGPPGRELLDAGVVSIGGAGARKSVRAVPPTIALRRLLDREHRKLTRLQNQLAETWERFTALVPPRGASDGARLGEDIDVIHDYAEMARLASGLYRSPRRLLRGTFNGHAVNGSTPEGVLLPPADSIAAGVEFRMIYDVKHVTSSWGSTSVRRSVAAGEHAKVRQTMPVKMMHVDDTTALVTIDPSGAAGERMCSAPALLQLLAGWFDLLWHDPGSTVIDAPDTADLTAAQRKVLLLLAAGLTDEAIAHHTGTAVRTVRRHVTAIRELLGVESRFAAGAAAAKRGWL
jgi:DNA-binding CsgD family transcriptional regulator